MARLQEQVAATAAQAAVAGQDALAARTLAAGADRDVSEVRAELRAHTQVLNALRQDHVELRAQVEAGFARVDEDFINVRGRLDGLAAGQQQIADLLTTLINRESGGPGD